MAVLSPQPKMQFTTAAGVPLSGGKVYTYTAGTTTPQATFTDYTNATPNTNPVILDSRGEANIWLGAAAYKFKLTDANDVEIWTVDYISAPTSGISPVLSGNVVIDSDTPGPALKITQTGTGPVLRVQDSTDPDTTPFIIDTNGNLGLGTAAPTAQLEATGAAKIGSLTLTSSPLPVASGGTNATTASTARTNLGAAASGAVTASGLTMATSRLLGRTTASTGAVEEISVGAGLSLSGGSLAATGVKAILRRTITSSGTYTVPAGVTALMFFVSGSQGGLAVNASGGLGGAGYAEKYIASPAASYSITIGAGGGSGTAGGTTTIDTISVTGGGGVTGTTGGTGGVASGGSFNANGGAGGTGGGLPSSGQGYGGGGAGGSRAGNGFAGGAGSATTGGAGGGGGGGGGGTGGAGSNASGTTGGAGGAAATTINASATSLTGYWPAPGTNLGSGSFSAGGQGGDGTGASGQPGLGANGDTPTGVYGLVMPGGRGGWQVPYTGSVTIWEFY